MLDVISANHNYQVQYLDSNGFTRWNNLLITNLIPSDDREAMLEDLTFLFRSPVVNYKYLGLGI